MRKLKHFWLEIKAIYDWNLNICEQALFLKSVSNLHKAPAILSASLVPKNEYQTDQNLGFQLRPAEILRPVHISDFIYVWVYMCMYVFMHM